MSATQLREKARAEILKAAEDETSALIGRDDDDATLHRRQGMIRGLHKAVDILNNNYKDLHG